MRKIYTDRLVQVLTERIEEAVKLRDELGPETSALWSWREDALREVLTMIQSGAYDAN